MGHGAGVLGEPSSGQVIEAVDGKRYYMCLTSGQRHYFGRHGKQLGGDAKFCLRTGSNLASA